MDSGFLSPVCDRHFVGFLDGGRRFARLFHPLVRRDESLALVLGTGARVENWWGWGALEETSAFTVFNGGWCHRARRRPALLI
jgi:hypothetical protein